ncbi:MAG: LON peptidase substrate-binding domain-containing protein [Acidimicrobiales bacterium]
MSSRLPQFPLGSVLLPTMLLPLHVFEPRYRRLVADVGDDGQFGVVLIERGSEVGVGGENVRASIGVVAKILRRETLADGRSTMLCVGTDRFRVTTWLDDDPYPIAEIEWLPDLEGAPCSDDAVATMYENFHLCRSVFERHGINTGPAPSFDPDPAVASFEVAALSPLGELDRYNLLRVRSASERVALLGEQLEASAATLEFRLSS